MAAVVRSPRWVVAAVALALAGSAALGASVPGGPAISGADGVPVGWNSWNAFACDISASRIEQQADALVSTGMRDAGWRYLVVDDCWVAPERTASGELTADPARFPLGMKAVADYVHARGLKFGLYTGATGQTCAQAFADWPGETGSLGHEATDAATFAAWGVDLVKDDWCGTGADAAPSPARQQAVFAAFRDGIRATGRPMTLMINPNSGVISGVPGSGDWSAFATTARLTNDVAPQWSTGDDPLGAQGVREIVAAAEDAVGSGRLVPGYRPDADMLEVGSSGLSAAEQRTQLGMLAALGLPLMAGTDLTALTPEARSLLINPVLPALAADTAGRPGRLADAGGVHVWSRATASGRVLALYNPMDAPASVDLLPLGLARATDLWTGAAVSGAVSVGAHDMLLLRG